MNKRWMLSFALASALGLAVFGAKDPHGHDHDHDHDHRSPATARAAEADDHEDEHEHDHDHGHDHDDHDHEDEDDHDHDDHGHAHAHGHDHDPHHDEVRLTPEAIRRHNVTVEPVRRRVLAAGVTAPARVSFNLEAMAHVGSVLAGRIVELKAKLGQTVAKGDELIVIESPEFAEAQSEFLLKRADVEIHAAAVEPAKQAYERAAGLYNKNEGISLAEVQKRQAEWQAAEGRLLAARAAATAAENKLHALGMDQAAVDRLAKTGEVVVRSSILAPIAGQVVQREVTLGELVNAERDALLVLADLSTLWVLADVPEGRMSAVRVGAEARVKVAGSDRPLAGKVTYVAPSLDAETRTVSVRIELPHHSSLRPGMFARAEIVAAADGGEPVVAVPEASIQTIEGRPSVFVPVKGEAGAFAVRAVKVGPATGGFVPVFEGLAEGEPVVTGGTFILKAELGKSGAGHEH